MTLEEIIDNRQKAEQEAINALIKAFNAMTDERNYYKEKVERIMDIPKPMDIMDLPSTNDTQSALKAQG